MYSTQLQRNLQIEIWSADVALFVSVRISTLHLTRLTPVRSVTRFIRPKLHNKHTPCSAQNWLDHVVFVRQKHCNVPFAHSHAPRFLSFREAQISPDKTVVYTPVQCDKTASIVMVSFW